MSTQLGFEGNRLTLARTLRGLLKKELAERIGKTPAAVGQFENGVHRPDRSTLASLALALRVGPKFFAPRTNDVNFPAEACHFRSLRCSTTRERRHLLARGAVIRDIVTTIEPFVDLPDVGVPEVKHGVENLRQAEGAAIAVRKLLGNEDQPLPSVVAMLETLGTIVVPINQGSRRVSAFSVWTGERPFVFLNNHEENARSRTRFDNAHELGHLVMHADSSPGDRELESQADRFASAFLLPRKAFMDECPPRLRWDDLLALKRRWGVSLAALVRRGYDLGRFSEATYRRAYVELNRRGWRRAEPGEDDLPLESPTLLRTSLEAAAKQGLTPQEVARDLGVSAGDISALVMGNDFPDAPLPEGQ